MGNESSLINDCKLERETPVVSPKPWRLYQAKRKDGSHLSVFVYEPDERNSSYIANAAKYLKVLRHPSILKFDGIEDTSDGVWLATEQVSPLESVLDDLSPAEVVAGIYNIIEGLVFLHERGGLSHNNLCLSSIFVSADGSWKLGGVEYLCRFDQASMSYLTKCKDLRDVNALAPEEKAGKLSSLDHGWARDVYGFGVLMEILLEYAADLGDLKKTFEIRIQDECLNPDPNRRPKLSSFLEDRLFKNDFLQIVNFLKNVTLKSEEEKRDFFGDITIKLYNLPIKLLASRLVRPLLSRFVLLDATSCQNVVPHLLSPYKDGPRPEYSSTDINPLLPQTLFKKYVIPEVYKIFHVRDAHIRMVLLEHFDCFADQFETNVLRQALLPQILLGLRDTNDELVRLSLHAVAYLVPILGGDVVVGTHRVKVFSESTPKFGAVSPAAPFTRGAATSEANGKIPKTIIETLPSSTSVGGHRNTPLASDKGASPEKKTLKDLARERERETRKQEAKKRNEERRKMRAEKQKHAQKVRLVSGGEELDNQHDGNTSNKSDWHESGQDAANEEGESDENEYVTRQTESDIDREIEDELEAMESTLSPDTHKKSPPAHKTEKLSPSSPRYPPSGGSKGALKLKSSKMRTSPPPNKKTSSSADYGGQAECESSLGGSHGEGSWGDGWDEPESEKWAEEDNKWTSTEWNDENYIEQTPKAKHSTDLSISGTSEHARVDASAVSTKNKISSGGGMSIKSKKQTDKGKNSTVVVTKPKTVDLDITKLDIKTSGKVVKSSEDDFFADMQPTIKPDKNSLWGMLNTDAVKTKSEVGTSGKNRTKGPLG